MLIRSVFQMSPIKESSLWCGAPFERDSPPVCVISILHCAVSSALALIWTVCGISGLMRIVSLQFGVSLLLEYPPPCLASHHILVPVPFKTRSLVELPPVHSKGHYLFHNPQGCLEVAFDVSYSYARDRRSSTRLMRPCHPANSVLHNFHPVSTVVSTELSMILTSCFTSFFSRKFVGHLHAGNRMHYWKVCIIHP